MKWLDGNGVKHTNRHECQVGSTTGSTIEKRVLENLKKIISGPITLKMLN